MNMDDFRRVVDVADAHGVEAREVCGCAREGGVAIWALLDRVPVTVLNRVPTGRESGWRVPPYFTGLASLVFRDHPPFGLDENESPLPLTEINPEVQAARLKLFGLRRENPKVGDDAVTVAAKGGGSVRRLGRTLERRTENEDPRGELVEAWNGILHEYWIVDLDSGGPGGHDVFVDDLYIGADDVRRLKLADAPGPAVGAPPAALGPQREERLLVLLAAAAKVAMDLDRKYSRLRSLSTNQGRPNIVAIAQLLESTCGSRDGFGAGAIQNDLGRGWKLLTSQKGKDS
ncbi:MAG: hypothetical protein ACOYOB_16995 [Myxococcota bacterium]